MHAQEFKEVAQVRTFIAVPKVGFSDDVSGLKAVSVAEDRP